MNWGWKNVEEGKKSCSYNSLLKIKVINMGK